MKNKNGANLPLGQRQNTNHKPTKSCKLNSLQQHNFSDRSNILGSSSRQPDRTKQDQRDCMTCTLLITNRPSMSLSFPSLLSTHSMPCQDKSSSRVDHPRIIRYGLRRLHHHCDARDHIA